jgi:hypothetical protein
LRCSPPERRHICHSQFTWIPTEAPGMGECGRRSDRRTRQRG